MRHGYAQHPFRRWSGRRFCRKLRAGQCSAPIRRRRADKTGLIRIITEHRFGHLSIDLIRRLGENNGQLRDCEIFAGEPLHLGVDPGPADRHLLSLPGLQRGGDDLFHSR